MFTKRDSGLAVSPRLPKELEKQSAHLFRGLYTPFGEVFGPSLARSSMHLSFGADSLRARINGEDLTPEQRQNIRRAIDLFRTATCRERNKKL